MRSIPLIKENLGASYHLDPYMMEDTSNTSQIINMRRSVSLVVARVLTDRQREVVDMYYIQGRKMPEIADVLGINKPAVSKALKRALVRIKTGVEYIA